MPRAQTASAQPRHGPKPACLFANLPVHLAPAVRQLADDAQGRPSQIVARLITQDSPGWR